MGRTEHWIEALSQQLSVAWTAITERAYANARRGNRGENRWMDYQMDGGAQVYVCPGLSSTRSESTRRGMFSTGRYIPGELSSH
jgi:hypothetical protein